MSRLVSIGTGCTSAHVETQFERVADAGEALQGLTLTSPAFGWSEPVTTYTQE